MDAEGMALARALVALPGWWWPDGTLWRTPPTPDDEDGGSGRADSMTWETPPPGALPVLDDPATGGCLLHMLGQEHDTRPEWLLGGGDGVALGGNPWSLGRACAAVMVERGWVTK